MRQVVLNLHGLGVPSSLLEPGEEHYWVPPELLSASLELAVKHANRVKVDFTFDDGNLSDIVIGAPLLEAAGYRGTFFVLADRLGAAGFLGAAHLRDLVARGHRIGTHGAAHVDWKRLDLSGLKHELITARARIEAATGQKIMEAGIPFGRYNAQVLRSLQAAGYTRAYSSDGGAVTGSNWPVPRTSLTREMDVTALEKILLGHESLGKQLRRRLAMAVKARL